MPKKKTYWKIRVDGRRYFFREFRTKEKAIEIAKELSPRLKLEVVKMTTEVLESEEVAQDE